jgi:hypothetical protein
MTTATPHEPPSFHRPVSFTLRRHRLLLLAMICLLSSAIFLLAPLLNRTYALSASFSIKPRAFDPLPELAALPDAALKQFAQQYPSIQVTTSHPDPLTRTVTLATAAPTRDAAFVRLHQFSDALSLRLRHQAEELTSSYRSRIAREEARLADREESLARDIQSFRDAHPGILPDDPTSIVSNFDKLNARLDEKQQRFRLVTDQISRLQEYKRNNQNKGAAAAPLPAPLPPPAPVAGETAAINPAADPEVAALTAQLQLISDQIDQQLNNEHRTEQHPYVVDLRNQQVTLQKRLDAARERAAAGKPAPPLPHTPLAAGPVSSVDPSLAAAQQVDLQIAGLQAEHDTLDTEVRALTAQHDLLQQQVNQVLPARREFEQLQAQLATTQKSRQTLHSQLEQFDRQFPADSSPALPPAIAAAPAAQPLVEVSPLSLSSSSTLPVFPQLPLVYAAGLLVSLAIAAAIVALLHKTDHVLHSPQEASTLLDVPLLGAVSEIRTPAQRRHRHLWRTAGRPLVSGILLLITVGSALICYRHIADPDFRGTGLRSALSLGDLQRFPDSAHKDPMP